MLWRTGQEPIRVCDLLPLNPSFGSRLMSTVLADLRDAQMREDMLGVSLEARRLLHTQVTLGAHWAEVAKAALDVGDELAALQAAQAYTQDAPHDLQAWIWLAATQAVLGRHEAALSVLETQLARFPRDSGLLRRAGRAQLELGRTAMAEAYFRRALGLNAADALAWEGLSECITLQSGESELIALEEARIHGGDSLSDADRGVLSYTLAKAYLDVGQADIAAMRVTEGAAFIRQGAPFDVDQHERSVNGLIGTYSPKFVENREEVGVLDARPVLLVAAPESGETWLTQVLAADPEAGALGRSNSLLWLNASPLGDQSRSAVSRAEDAGWGQNVLGEIVKRYLRQAEEALGRPCKRIIDPTAVGEIAAGAFGLCLPAAKLVHVTRDVRDLAWSIYKTRYRKARHWTYHPDDIARVLACHKQLMAHWADLYGDRLLTISYEDMAQDPQAIARQVAVFTGVDEDAVAAEAWLRSDAFKSSSIGVHKQAGGRFEPLEAALGRAGLV